ncbi:hypothetical protein Dimus_018985 [Dionaea muscipula]
MCQEMQRLACRSAPYKEAYIQYMEGVHELSTKIETTITSVEASRMGKGRIGASSGAASCGYGVASSQDVLDDTQCIAKFTPSQLLILDPNLSQTKGRTKDAKGKEIAHSSGRIKSSIETATHGRKRLCRSCNKLVNHDKRNCPFNPNSKRKKQLVQSKGSDDDDDDEEMDDAISIHD